MKDYGDKLSSGNKEAIQKALSELKEAHKEKNVTAIDTSMAALNTVWQAASEEMYKATQNASQADSQQGQPAGEQGQQKSDAEVTDVDFEEVKEDKK